MTDDKVTVIGGGLAGVEAAWRLAKAGHGVELVEMRPETNTPAHQTGDLAELVCSNSLRAESPTSAVGLLKEEMTALDSLVMEAALATRVPAGKALAVDRAAFSARIQARLAETDLTISRREIRKVPERGRVIMATGPLTSDALAEDLAAITGSDHLHFYDAIAPIVDAESIDMSKAFWASRWTDPADEADYLNLAMDKDLWTAFYEALIKADQVSPRDFEKAKYFEGCLPIEVMAQRGEQTLLFGPLKPVGLVDPRTGERAHAVIQLRKEDAEGRYLNLVGFQTRLTHSAQDKVFRLIPGLENAEFVRLGSIHRNTFVCGPQVLDPDLSLKGRKNVILAGQVTGVEGYVESAATGILAGEFMRRRLAGLAFVPPPPETALGALLGHATAAPVKRFQPSNVHFGLMPPLGRKMPKRDRGAAYRDRGRPALAAWLEMTGGA